MQTKREWRACTRPECDQAEDKGANRETVEMGMA